MKKILPVRLLFIILNVFLTACGNNGNLASSGQEKINEAEQKTESFTSSVISEGEKAINIPNSVAEESKSQAYEVKSDYMQWTYLDWENATQEQREKCNEVFSNAMGRETDLTNLGKIFGTNPNKNLSEIIQLQKSEESSLQEGEQPDPGHGAAAGLM